MGRLEKTKLIFHLFWECPYAGTKNFAAKMGVCLINQKLALKTQVPFFSGF